MKILLVYYNKIALDTACMQFVKTFNGQGEDPKINRNPALLCEVISHQQNSYHKEHLHKMKLKNLRLLQN